PCISRIDSGGGHPSVRAWIVFPACVQEVDEVASFSTPNDHFAASPYGAVPPTCVRGVARTCAQPAIRNWVIPAAGVKMPVGIVEPAPDDHLAAGPHCCMRISGIRSVGGAGSCPSVRVRIIPAACIKKGAEAIPASPNNHFVTSPYSCVVVARVRWTGGGCPCAIDATASAFRCLWEPVVIHWDCDCITYLGFSSS